MSKKFLVTLKKSTISCSKTQKNTVNCLGLGKVNSFVTLADNSANRGQLIKIQHLISVQVIN